MDQTQQETNAVLLQKGEELMLCHQEELTEHSSIYSHFNKADFVSIYVIVIP